MKMRREELPIDKSNLFRNCVLKDGILVDGCMSGPLVLYQAKKDGRNLGFRRREAGIDSLRWRLRENVSTRSTSYNVFVLTQPRCVVTEFPALFPSLQLYWK